MFCSRPALVKIEPVAVYVDDARIRRRGHSWSHLVAHTAEELHRAAERLGLRREWAQGGRTLHYDLPEHLRERAIADGLARPIGWRDLARRRAEFASGPLRVGPGAGAEHVRRRREAEAEAAGDGEQLGPIA
jgi:hypothetical protein